MSKSPLGQLSPLNIYEVDYEVIEPSGTSSTSGSKAEGTVIRLNLPNIEDKDFPTVSIVVPTCNRPEFRELIIRNWERIEYPREKLELIIYDDSPKSKRMKNPSELFNRIRYYTSDKKLSIGEKRNVLCGLAKHDYIVHMDDDDWYKPESVACRIRVLLEFEKKIGRSGCFGCTKVQCIDLVSNQMFEAYDAASAKGTAALAANSAEGVVESVVQAVQALPATISESTMAYSKKYWKEQRWDDGSTYAECLPFIKGRHHTVCSGPSVFIVIQFTHDKNTVQRRVERTLIAESNFERFEKSLTVYDASLYNVIRANVIMRIPSYIEAVEFVKKASEYDTEGTNRFLKEYNWLDSTIKANPLVIELYQTKMTKKMDTETSGATTGDKVLDIVYYCGPGQLFKFSNKWNPESKQLGGSEEAVIGLSNQMAQMGHNVTVYCCLEGTSKQYGLVNYKPYYRWLPRDAQDITIVWRDPHNCRPDINSKRIFLDLHDAVDPRTLRILDPSIVIMTKSMYHSKIITSTCGAVGTSTYEGQSDPLHNRIINVPNGISTPEADRTDKATNTLLCTSSPDRCIEALLRAMPLIRQEIPDAQIRWAYGFSAGISEGGLEKDPRTKSWVSSVKNQINNTPGFVDLGRLSQSEINEEYQKADFFIYPTRFPEIDCISLTKSLHYGAIPLVTTSGAMAEKLGLSGNMAKLTSESIDYSLEDGPEFRKFVRHVIKCMKGPRPDRSTISNMATKYSWTNVANEWMSLY